METSNFLNHSGENESAKSTRVDNGAKSAKRRREESPYLKIRSKAANLFRSQIEKSVNVKKLAVETAISKIVSGDYTRNRFLSEFKTNVDLLLDSKRFERECKQHNLVPFNAATHIVFDGSSKIELVLKNGVHLTYSNQLLELIEPIYTLEELEAVSEVKVPVSEELPGVTAE
jgi:spore germination protein GerM